LALAVWAVAAGPSASAAPVSIPLRVSSLNRLVFDLPYTLGTHSGRVTRLEIGSVLWDKDSGRLDALDLSFRVNDIDMDGAKLKCHMREALELDYPISQFPESHVCSNNQLPAEGPDSSRYPVIRFRAKPGAFLKLGEVTGQSRSLPGELTLHGVTREKTLMITELREDHGKIHIKGGLEVPLKDFGITVKPFLVVTVGDLARVQWDWTLELP